MSELSPSQRVKVALVIGTRPEIVKMAPVITAIRDLEVPTSLLHTGQHYDRDMSEVFLEELGVGTPDRFLEVGSGSHGEQTAQALVRLEDAFTLEEPSLILVEGDTNTVLATALAAVKLGIALGHVEAGPRSHDLRMPEEHNRRVTDHLSSLLFAPSETCEQNLRREAVWGQIYVTGNPVIDSCLRFLPVAEKRSQVLGEVPYEEYCLATLHRPENVDNGRILKELVTILISSPLPVVYPIHPRTERRLQEFGLHETLARSENVHLMPPKGYFDFLLLMKRATFLLTDSGGIQEEATAPNLRKKVFVLRESTESPEAVAAGYAEVLGTEAEKALARIRRYAEDPEPPEPPSPYGEGTSGEQIAHLVQEVLEAGNWPLRRSPA